MHGSRTIHASAVSCRRPVEPVKLNTTKRIKLKIIMKSGILLTFALAASLLAGCATEKDEKSEKHTHKSDPQAKLMAEAKVSKADAEKIALAKVPTGTIKEGELEKEDGKLIWSFDMTTPDSKDITEVAVDAVTGAVVAVDKETPADQAKEKEADAKEKKDNKKDKD
jgi:uncharacterized membrane protein YkoI